MDRRVPVILSFINGNVADWNIGDILLSFGNSYLLNEEGQVHSCRPQLAVLFGSFFSDTLSKGPD